MPGVIFSVDTGLAGRGGDAGRRYDCALTPGALRSLVSLVQLSSGRYWWVIDGDRMVGAT